MFDFEIEPPRTLDTSVADPRGAVDHSLRTVGLNSLLDI